MLNLVLTYQYFGYDKHWKLGCTLTNKTADPDDFNHQLIIISWIEPPMRLNWHWSQAVIVMYRVAVIWSLNQ